MRNLFFQKRKENFSQMQPKLIWFGLNLVQFGLCYVLFNLVLFVFVPVQSNIDFLKKICSSLSTKI